MEEPVNPSFFLFDVNWLRVFLRADAFYQVEGKFEHVVLAFGIEAILEIVALFLAESLFLTHLFEIHKRELILNIFINHAK